MLVVGMFFLACENDLNQVKVVTATDDSPETVFNELHTLYSDSGIVRFEMIATRTENYTHPKNKTLFKNGLKVNFFKRRDSIVSTLTAEYAELLRDESKIIARNNVIFTNHEKKQTLKTEELYWDQARKQVMTDKSFEVIGQKTYARGVGLESDETFSDYKMHKVTAEYKIESKDTLR